MQYARRYHPTDILMLWANKHLHLYFTCNTEEDEEVDRFSDPGVAVVGQGDESYPVSEQATTRHDPHYYRQEDVFHSCTEERVSGTEGRVSGTEGRVSGTEGRVSGTEGRVSGTEGRVSGTEGRVSGTKGRVSGIEGRVSGTEGRVSDTEGRVSDGNVHS